MSKKPSYWNKAKKYLYKKDSIMRDLIIRYSDANLTSRKDVFFSLCKMTVCSFPSRSTPLNEMGKAVNRTHSRGTYE